MDVVLAMPVVVVYRWRTGWWGRSRGANILDGGLCRNPDTLAKLQAAQKELKSADEDAYVNMEKSNEEKDAGNAAFKAAK